MVRSGIWTLHRWIFNRGDTQFMIYAIYQRLCRQFCASGENSEKLRLPNWVFSVRKTISTENSKYVRNFFTKVDIAVSTEKLKQCWSHQFSVLFSFLKLIVNCRKETWWELPGWEFPLKFFHHNGGSAKKNSKSPAFCTTLTAVTSVSQKFSCNYRRFLKNNSDYSRFSGNFFGWTCK